MGRVDPDAVVVTKNGEEVRVPYGTCVWTTGIRMHPLAQRLIEKLSDGELNVCEEESVISVEVLG